MSIIWKDTGQWVDLQDSPGRQWHGRSTSRNGWKAQKAHLACWVRPELVAKGPSYCNLSRPRHQIWLIYLAASPTGEKIGLLFVWATSQAHSDQQGLLSTSLRPSQAPGASPHRWISICSLGKCWKVFKANDKLFSLIKTSRIFRVDICQLFFNVANCRHSWTTAQNHNEAVRVVTIVVIQ